MGYVYLILGWVVSIVAGLLAVSMILTRNLPQAVALLGVIVLALPPAAPLVNRISGPTLAAPIRVVAIGALLAAFVWLGSANPPQSIYASSEAEAQLMAIYDARLAEWPIPYESVFVDTEYGRVHVIVSGREGAPPVLLLHASGVAAWSWLYNVEALAEDYRIYAIDTIGDAGKSSLSDRDNFPRDGQALSELYADISGKLGVERAYVVGASQGGFIGTNYALYAPERVDKLILLGPMGYAGTNASVVRIVLTTLFPLRWLQESTMRWALGEDPRVLDTCGEWFRLLLAGVMSQQARPQTLPPEQLRTLAVPVMLVLGANDNLVGDPERARLAAQNIPNLRVEVVDTGHLIGVEDPERVNALILEFLRGE